jgi:hypothetical protein
LRLRQDARVIPPAAAVNMYEPANRVQTREANARDGYRCAAKNSCISAADSSASTPATTSA